MNLLMMPILHVGQGTHLGGLSVFPVWTDATVGSGHRASGSGGGCRA